MSVAKLSAAAESDPPESVLPDESGTADASDVLDASGVGEAESACGCGASAADASELTADDEELLHARADEATTKREKQAMCLMKTLQEAHKRDRSRLTSSTSG